MAHFSKTGRLVLPAPDDPVEFATLMVNVEETACKVEADTPMRPEIVAGGVTIRLETGASADRIASVVCALAGCL